MSCCSDARACSTVSNFSRNFVGTAIITVKAAATERYEAAEATAKINAILSGRRGQILGFDTREGWTGWDSVRALMPETEIGDLIIEVRSATAGVGSFTFKFDHMAELTGRLADQVMNASAGGTGTSRAPA